MKLGASINEMSLVGAVTGHCETSRRFVDSSIVLQSYYILNISFPWPGWADAENHHGDHPGHAGHEEEAAAGEAGLQTRLPQGLQLITVSRALSCDLYSVWYCITLQQKQGKYTNNNNNSYYILFISFCFHSCIFMFFLFMLQAGEFLL